jgi:purine-binding chemotaxis protein CheW
VDDRHAELSLICRVQNWRCALALSEVVEILRPLPVEAVAGAPFFLRGLALIRGMPLPVVDAARLLGDTDGATEPGRFIVLRVAERRVALAVDEVLGVRALPADARHALPPLLDEAGRDGVAGIGRLDAELLLVLRGARLLADDLMAQAS